MGASSIEAVNRALTRPGARGWAALAAVAVLAVTGFAALRSVRAPAPLPESAPAEEFSAERAFRHVEAIAARPHPIGSAANDAVREHLVTTLRGLGLTTEVQDAVTAQGAKLSASAGGTGMARVRNVIAVLPGTAPTGRVFLAAHYDSVQNGPGANDDAVGVAAVLESARVLAAGPRPRNDVVFVLTDGEEGGLFGAKAFVDQHPLARDGGVVVNLEARGSTGPAIMFETARDNAGLVGVFARAPHPVGTSFAVEIYRLMPNNTDFTPFTAAGFTGLNSAHVDGVAWYHTPLDTPSAVDLRTLQHHGGNLLGLARELGGSDLPGLRSDGDATYFPAPGGRLVHYPGSWTWPLAAGAVLGVLALGWLIRRRGLASLPRQAVAFGSVLVPLLAAPALAQGFWLLMKVIRPEYAALAVDPYRPWWFRFAVLSGTAAVVLGWYALLRRRLTPAALAAAGLGWLAVLGVVLAAVAPGGSYLAALPALAGALAGIPAVLLGARSAAGWVPLALVTAGAAVAVVVLLPTLVLFFPALGMNLAASGALLATLLSLALLPVLDLLHPEAGGQRGMASVRARRRGASPALAALLALAGCAAAGLTVNRFDRTHPVPSHLMYALDADTGEARWLSESGKAVGWLAQYVGGTPAPVTDLLPHLGDERVLSGPAAAAALPPARVTVRPETGAEPGGATGAAAQRTVKVLVTPARAGRLITLHAARETEVVAATAAGREVPLSEPGNGDGAWGTGFVFHAPPPEGVEVTLTVVGTGPVRLRVAEVTDGFDRVPGFRPRPADVGVAGSHSAEMLAVAQTRTV